MLVPTSPGSNCGNLGRPLRSDFWHRFQAWPPMCTDIADCPGGRTTFLRVKEVAASVGWNDVSHFVRDYKATYRQTPSQTRSLSYRTRRRIL